MNKYTNIENKIKALIEEKTLDQKASELLSLAEKSNVSVYALNLLIECGYNAENAMVINKDGILKVKIPVESDQPRRDSDEQLPTAIIEPQVQPSEAATEAKNQAESVEPEIVEAVPKEMVELKFIEKDLIQDPQESKLELETLEPTLDEQIIPLVVNVNESQPEVESKPQPQLEPIAINQTWYALRPDGENGFLIKELSTNIEDRYYYKIEQKDKDKAEFTLVEDEGLQQNAILSDSLILRGACDYENEPEGSKGIVVVHAGRLKRKAKEWSIVQKAKIRFIAPPPPVSIPEEPVFKLKEVTADSIVEADFNSLKVAFTENKTRDKKTKQQLKQETSKKNLENKEDQSSALLNAKTIDYLLYGSILLTLILIVIIVWKYFL